MWVSCWVAHPVGQGADAVTGGTCGVQTTALVTPDGAGDVDVGRGLDPAGATGYGVRTLANWVCNPA